MAVVAWTDESDDRGYYRELVAAALADGDFTEALDNYGLGGNIQLSGNDGAGFAVTLLCSNDGVTFCEVPVVLSGAVPCMFALPDIARHAKQLALSVAGDGTTDITVHARLRTA